MTEIINYNPSTNQTLARALTGLEVAIQEAAEANVRMAVGDQTLPQTAIQSMILIDQLKQVNGLELAAVLLRGKYIREIEQTNALLNHPGRYEDLNHMAREQGISKTELSQTRDLVNIIFPYVQDVLGVPIPQLWEQIGKSNFKELIPTLKTIITGERSNRDGVNNGVELILEQVRGNFAGDPGEDEVRATAVDMLLQHGSHLTNRELRRQIRPSRTPDIEAAVIKSSGSYAILAEMDEEQYALFLRQMGSHLSEHIVELPNDPRQRQMEATRIPQLRRIYRLMEGE